MTHRRRKAMKPSISSSREMAISSESEQDYELRSGMQLKLMPNILLNCVLPEDRDGKV